MKSFKDIPPQELIEAIAKMCESLEISGSIYEEYDIYRAVTMEQERYKSKPIIT